MEVRLKEKIPGVFWPVHQAIRRGEVTEVVAKGGRGSGKSSYLSLELVLQLLRHPDCHAVVLRKVAGTLRNSNASIYESMRYASGTNSITYRFDNLTGEDYTVYVGMFNPTGWVESGKTRLADIKINGETLQTGYNYYTSCTGKGDTLAFTGLKSDADGVLTVEVAANANTTSAVQVSFIMVSGEVKTPEPAPETKTEVVKDTLTKDNIPQGIKDKGYDTPEKITEAFKKAISKNQSADNIEVYDVKLMISTDNGAHWSEATDAYFPAGGMGKKRKFVKAVDDVSFFVNKGETLGLVGESGCGKTTTGRSILRLYEPTGGKITFDGNVILDVENKVKVDMLPYRQKMQMVFQDPYASLDPRMTVGDIVGEAIDIHKLAANKKERHDTIISMLEKVGLNSEHANRYPHEFSGGQRQRVGIARALAVNPQFIVCDEPISALDVSIQAQVVNMFEELQEQMGLTYLFIAHDLSVVKHISDRIGVMYLGKMVELADSYELVARSLHPYTKSLISAIPIADPIKARASKRIVLQGDVPSPLNPPTGCRFRTRCPYADECCAQKEPEWREVEKGHYVACHHVEKINA